MEAHGGTWRHTISIELEESVCSGRLNLDEDIFVGMMGLDHFVSWTSWHKSCWVTRGYTQLTR